jgi:TrmH family RNA methyltransferase
VSGVLIRSLQNPTVKRLIRLRDNRSRRRAERVLVDGWRETRRAMEAGLKPLGIYTVPEEAASSTASAGESAAWVLDHAGQSLQSVTAEVMQRISYGQSSRGVVAEFESPRWNLSQLTVPNSPLVLILDRFEKPGNVGAAFRCADAAGVDAVLLTPESCDRFNPNAIRSSLGAVFSVPSATCSEAEARRWLREYEIRVFAARVESSLPIWETDLVGPVGLLIGSEAHGLGEHWQPANDCSIASVQIPMNGRVDSLNASVSAAVLLYEAARQRAVGK